MTIEDSNTGKKITYQLVGPCESDLERNRISVTSPIGKALIGKCVGDEVSVQTPGGIRDFEIVDISIGEEYSNSKSKRTLCWLRLRLLDVCENTPASPPPCRLEFIFDLEPE